MAEQERDRRLDPRVADGVIHVEYVVPSPQVRDLSVSGVYQWDTRPMLVGQPVELRMRLSNAEPMVIRGMVRRVDPGRGMAIEFIHISGDDRRSIKEFISRASPDKVSAADEGVS